MNSTPPILARVPNMLTSQMVLGSITRTNTDLIQLQMQLASGYEILRPSDDPVGASTVSILDNMLERREQRIRNLSHAEAMLGTIDTALSDVSDILLEAKGIGLGQIGVGSDAQTRTNQAEVINSIIQSMQAIGNREYRGIHVFGGASNGTPPFAGLLNGVQYVGDGDGLVTDLGLSISTPITVAGERAFGAVSGRLEGDRDLDPSVTGTTRLADLRGARGLGVTRSAIDIRVNGEELSVDLSTASTVEDVRSALEAAIQSVDPTSSIAIDPISGSAFAITPGVGTTIEIPDDQSGIMAADLGISGSYINGITIVTGDLDQSLTWTTPVDSLSGISMPMGTIRIENGGQSRDVDLSGAETLQDIRNSIEQLGIGIRVDIADSGDRMTIRNEVSGSSMSIGEVGGGTTATELGIRSMSGSTLLSSFNDGRGVEAISGAVDPETGLLDPARNMDFSITLSDGSAFEVDLGSAKTVDEAIAQIEDAAQAAGLGVPGQFSVGLASDGNGFVLTDGTGGTGGITVAALNNSSAAHQLGILGTSDGATLAGEDRAKVAVDGMFSHLISLRDALLANDETGIAFAVEGLESDIARVTEARAEVGVRAQRVEDASTREQDLSVQDLALKSSIQDLDFTEAAVRFSTLQQQLQAALSTAGNVTSLTLLDFLR